MTHAASVLATSRPAVVQVLSDLIAEIADQYGTGCLLVDADARLLVHALSAQERDPVVVAAVLAGDTRSFEQALVRRRTLGLTAAGPVIAARLPSGATTVWVPLPEDTLMSGGLWLLLGTRPCPPMKTLDDLAAQLLEALHAQERHTEVRAALEGLIVLTRMPSTLAGCQKLWVVASSGRGLRALHATDLTFLSCSSAGDVLTLVGGREDVTTEEVARCIGTCSRDGSAGVSAPVRRADQLAAATAQARLMLGAARPGRVLCTEDGRGLVVMAHLARSLQELPDLGADPLQALREYDQRRGSDLVPTLRAWLAAGGDVPTVTAELGIHPNTLRYRLQRIADVGGFDLHRDVQARTELYLRLCGSPGD